MVADIVCFECGSAGAPAIVDCLFNCPADLAALKCLASQGAIELTLNATFAEIRGTDRIGMVILPSGRRLILRSKINGLALLSWLSYLREFPEITTWLSEPGVASGEDWPLCIARLLVHELEKITRTSPRQEYTGLKTTAATVRGRIVATSVYRAIAQLPRLDQIYRGRTVNTPQNKVLAIALDRACMLLGGETDRDVLLIANLRDAWGSISRQVNDLCATVMNAQWGCPPNYKAALLLSRLLLFGCAIDPESPAGGQAFLLSFSAIWENGLRQMLRELADTTGWNLLPDSSRTRRWDDATSATERDRWMTSDALLERDGCRWSLDAKYKRDFGNESRSDRFQMCAYALGFDAERVSLVYPTGDAAWNHHRLLKVSVGTASRTIDSVELPMAAGPSACRSALAAFLMQEANDEPALVSGP